MLNDIVTAIAVTGGVLGIFSTVLPWIFKARDTDTSLKQTLELLNANLNFNNQLLNRDIERIRDDIAELRIQQRESATRSGKRISITKTILLKLINHLNTEKEIKFPFVDLKELED